ncbi:Mycothiol acetyltransferase [subsurface metagenome]
MKRKVELKDGREITIRPLTPEDNEKIYEMFAAMSEEALRWSMAPYTRERIERWMSNIENLILLGAEHDRSLIGYAQLHRETHPRRRGMAELSVYLHQDYHGAGLGTAITQTLLQEARAQGVHKVNLGTVDENETAIRLFTKLGFEQEGRLRDCFYSDDNLYHDIIMMGLILDEEPTA